MADRSTTLIVDFHRAPMKNIAACASLSPKTLVLVGENPALQFGVARYEQFIKDRSLDITVRPCAVDCDDLYAVADALTDILQGGECYVLDLWEGTRAIAAAAGIAYDRCKDTCCVQMQYLTPLGKAMDGDGDGYLVPATAPKIGVTDLIALYGGVVAPATTQPSHVYTFADIRSLWQTSFAPGVDFNRGISAINEFEKQAMQNGDNLNVTIPFYNIQANIVGYPQKRRLFNVLLSHLETAGAVRIIRRTENSFCYQYKNPLVRYCLKKAGNLLECVVFLKARDFTQNGKPFFDDLLMGVNIDWDGVLHPSVPGGIKDTHNEIDVLLMRGLTPIFISCKNGKVNEEELYKLQTVATRFGGKYVKTALIATDFDPDSIDTKMSLLQRAADMHIHFESAAFDLDDAEWEDLFLRIAKVEE